MPTNLSTLSLIDLFGEGATQNATTLVIQKSGLRRLTPQLTNSAESILAALFVTALPSFSGVLSVDDTNTLTLEEGQSLTFDNSDAFEFLKLFQWRPYQFDRSGQKYINNQVIVESYDTN